MERKDECGHQSENAYPAVHFQEYIPHDQDERLIEQHVRWRL